MDVDSGTRQIERRWLFFQHALVAGTLSVATAVVVAQRPPGLPGTLGVAAVFAVWYVAMYTMRAGHGGRTGAMLVYVVGALALYGVLVARADEYFLLVYALLPLFFSALARWLAVVCTVILIVLPDALAGELDSLLGPSAISLVGAIGLGLAMTAIMTSFVEHTRRQQRMIAELDSARAENARLATEAARQGRTAGILAERQRLAHDIHDTLAQGFTSIVTQLEAAEQAIGTNDIRVATHIGRAKQTARDSLGEARRTVEALRPEALERAGLPGALRDLATRWRDAQTTAIDVTVTVDGAPVRMPASVDGALVRVAQEALTNVGRHAHARQATLTLSYLDDVVLLDIQDDGVGFTVDGAAANGHEPARRGYGMISMRERVALVGGDLTVESVPGDGTTVVAEIPLVNDRHDPR